MDNNETYRIGNSLPPFINGLLFLLIALMGFTAIGPLIGSFVATLFYDVNPVEIQSIMSNPANHASLKGLFYLIQGSATGIGMIVIPLVYVRFVNRKSLSVFSRNRTEVFFMLMAMIIVWLFMVVNSVIIEWNESLGMPASLSGVESWMRQMEDRAKEITEYLTTFNSFGDFMVAVIVIAILPSIGEELVFRGYLQTEFTAAFRNPHVAIWLSAFLFSAIHIQFFGFFPRLLLGALFGYLYFWSGNIWYPIAGHFLQNGAQLLILYFAQLELMEIDLNSGNAFSNKVIFVFAVLTCVAIYYFRKWTYIQRGKYE